MKLKQKQIALAIATLVSATPSFSATTGYAQWLTQIGISDAVTSAANWGKGQTLGVVDTGIAASNPMFATGQVSKVMSSCAAITFRCSNGANDDQGHGTAVASIAAANAGAPGSYLIKGASSNILYKGMAIGVAQNANIVAEKVLNANGSGYSTDVANGLRKAADAGASVINLSLTYSNGADLVSAINYATSKGSFVVWAGGNDAVNLLNGASTNGLTPDAINKLVFVGSVNSVNGISSFSNKPGAGNIVGTDKSNTAYAKRWIVAPGESIFAPVATSPGAYGLWTGTSMSAPIVSGSLILLESAWPVLKTKGTAANLLLATTNDLGAAGVDSVYGNGIVNLTKAFQPYGTLSVAQANGTMVPVANLNGKLITNGALGSLSAVQSKLANYTSFDAYSRNFSINLSGLIKTAPTAATLNALPKNVNNGPVVMKLNGVGEFTMMQYTEPTENELIGLHDREKVALTENRPMYAMLNDKTGNTVALGFGFPVNYVYSRALYGNDDMAKLSSELNLVSLSSLAEGGNFMAYGTKLSDSDRIAVSWSQSPDAKPSFDMLREASSLNLGFTHQVNKTVMLGANFSTLNETSGILGASYSGNALNFGTNNASEQFGVSMAVNLSAKNTLLLEAGFANTKGNQGSGLIGQTSDISAQSYGVTFMSKAMLNKEDNLNISIKAPMRVTSGYTNVLNTTVDAEGLPVSSYDKVSLVPDGREIDMKVSYNTPLAHNQNLSLSAGFRNDVNNTKGEQDVNLGVTWGMKF